MVFCIDRGGERKATCFARYRITILEGWFPVRFARYPFHRITSSRLHEDPRIHRESRYRPRSIDSSWRWCFFPTALRIFFFSTFESLWSKIGGNAGIVASQRHGNRFHISNYVIATIKLDDTFFFFPSPGFINITREARVAAQITAAPLVCTRRFPSFFFAMCPRIERFEEIFDFRRVVSITNFDNSRKTMIKGEGKKWSEKKRAKYRTNVDLNRVMLTDYYILRNIDRVSSAIYHRARINGWIRGTRYFYT